MLPVQWLRPQSARMSWRRNWWWRWRTRKGRGNVAVGGGGFGGNGRGGGPALAGRGNTASDASEEKAFVYDKNHTVQICVTCLGVDHLWRECTNICVNCRKMHEGAICPLCPGLYGKPSNFEKGLVKANL